MVPFINFSLISKVPDSIIPISENNQDLNVSGDVAVDASSSGYGAFGIGNTRLIKIIKQILISKGKLITKIGQNYIGTTIRILK